MRKLTVLLIALTSLVGYSQKSEGIQFVVSDNLPEVKLTMLQLPNDTIPKTLITKKGIQNGYAVMRVYECIYDVNGNHERNRFYKTLHYLIEDKVVRIDAVYCAANTTTSSGLLTFTPPAFNLLNNE